MFLFRRFLFITTHGGRGETATGRIRLQCLHNIAACGAAGAAVAVAVAVAVASAAADAAAP